MTYRDPVAAGHRIAYSAITAKILGVPLQEFDPEVAEIRESWRLDREGEPPSKKAQALEQAIRAKLQEDPQGWISQLKAMGEAQP